MLFNSLEYLLFFPTVVVVHFLLPHRFRWIALLVASFVFYMSFMPIYALVLCGAIGIDFLAALILERTQGTIKKTVFVASILATGALLFAFKYFSFFRTNTLYLFHVLGVDISIPDLQLILPLGLSFHTLQSLSYVIEVYRGNQRAERNIGIFALYVTFFPQLIAGPIERPGNLLWQFRAPRDFSYFDAVAGLQLILWGLIKKVVVADRLGQLVNVVYGSPDFYSSGLAIVASVFFALQIYFDFSGYSDIAVGSARVLGFRLMENFNFPFFAKTMTGYWRAWHISFTSWLRDYIYFPLGGSRVGPIRWCINIFVTFLVSGLWHGANWTYVVWAMLHAFYTIFGRFTLNWRSGLSGSLGLERVPIVHKLLTFFSLLSLVSFTWVFYRAESVAQSLRMLSRMVREPFSSVPGSIPYWDLAHFGPGYFFCCLLGIGVVFGAEHFQQTQRMTAGANRPASPWRWTLYYASIIYLVVFGVFDESRFVYFQF